MEFLEETPIETMFREAAVGRIAELEPQQWIGPYRVDFLVRGKRLVIELDGHEFHKTKEQRTRDASRQRYLQSVGYEVVRFTGTEIFKNAALCVGQTLALLRKRPDFIRNTEEPHPTCYYAIRLQDAVTSLLDHHNVSLHHAYCYARFEMPGPWDPFSIEKHDNIISVKHFTEQGGDIVFDPMIELAIVGDADDAQWVPLTLQNPWMFLDAATCDGQGNVQIISLDQQMEIATLCELWGRSLRGQGWFADAKLVKHEEAEEV